MNLDLSPYHCLGDAFREACNRFKDNLALIEIDRNQEKVRLTFAEVKAEAERIAAHLQQAGFLPGDLCAVVMSNQSKWIIAAVGAFWAGAVLVPLDYKASSQDQMKLLANSRPKSLVTEWSIWKDLSSEPQETLKNAWVMVSDAPKDADLKGAVRWESASQAPYRYQERKRDDVATIPYTSGTGGRPRGCQLTHQNHFSQFEQVRPIIPFDTNDRLFGLLPLHHCFPFFTDFVYPFLQGTSVIHQRTVRAEFTVSTMKRYHITIVTMVPLILKAFCDGILTRLEAMPLWKRKIFNGLRVLNSLVPTRKWKTRLGRLLFKDLHDEFGGQLRGIVMGGTFTDPVLADFFCDLGFVILIAYGMTEAGLCISMNDREGFRSDTVGKPFSQTTVQIRNVDKNGIGQIWVKGPCVMKGYLDEPELTGEVLVEGWLWTGDLGRMEGSGHLKIMGREKDVIVTEGGKNVYPEDIENAFQNLPDCEEICIFTSNYIWRDQKLNQDQLLIVVRSISEKPMERLTEELQIRNQVLDYYKHVRACLIWDKKFPRTTSMKIKRQQLAREIATSLSRESILKID